MCYENRVVELLKWVLFNDNENLLNTCAYPVTNRTLKL